MRIKTFIKLLDKNKTIPPTSRQTICHLIKSGLEKSNSNMKEKFYDNEENFIKPFTFSTYFPFDNNKNFINNSFSIIFSSNNYEFLISIYNGILELSKDKNYKLFGSEWKLERFLVLPEKNFTENSATFKTLSPFMVRDPEDGDKYLYPINSKIQTNKNITDSKYWKSSENFCDALKKSMESLLKKELPDYNEDFNINIELKNITVFPIVHGSGNINHSFKMTFPGIKGEIKINATKEALKLFYDIGIGARRSEGFGMLEVACD